MKEKIQRLKTLIEDNPSRKDAYFLLADAYNKTNQFEEARQALYKAIELDRLYLKAYSSLGEMLIKYGNIEEAEELFESALIYFPRNIDYCLTVARIYKNTRIIDKAIDYYKKCIIIENLNPDIYHEIAQVYLINEEYEKAQQQLRKAIELNPKNISFFLDYAFTYYMQKEYKRALEVLTEGVKAEKYSSRMHLLMAKIYSALEMEREYQEEIEVLNKIDPEMVKELG